jgi:uncharacterized protein (TIGR03435 family)
MTKLRAAAFAFAAMAAVLHAQSPAFDAASIKRNTGSQPGSRGQLLPGGRVVLTNTTVRGMLRNYLRLQDYQIAGGPEWVATERWDVVAKADPSASSDVVLQMVRTLLADRFKLVTHTEMRELPIYALLRSRPDGRLGPNLRPTSIDCIAYEAAQRAAAPPAPGATPVCGVNSSEGNIHGGARSMTDIARTLSIMTGRAVVDKTGLTGQFDIDVTWTPDLAAAGDASGGGGSLFTAIQEQIGLKLEAQRGPVDVLVIDSIERPVED